MLKKTARGKVVEDQSMLAVTFKPLNCIQGNLNHLVYSTGQKRNVDFAWPKTVFWKSCDCYHSDLTSTALVTKMR